MDDPGAKTSVHGPKFENDALFDVLVSAPTVTAAGTRAGEKVQASTLLFPAATAKEIPESIAF